MGFDHWIGTLVFDCCVEKHQISYSTKNSYNFSSIKAGMIIAPLALSKLSTILEKIPLLEIISIQ